VPVRNIARGGGKKFKVDIQGLKELETKLRALKMDNPQIVGEIYHVVGAAADNLRDDMRSAARSAGWGAEKAVRRKGVATTKAITMKTFQSSDGKVLTGDDAINSIFSFDEPRGGTNKISALAGLNKKRTMVRWKAGKHPKSKNAKVAPGGEVAMAFASMLEFGTSIHRSRPAIRKAVQSGRQRIIDTIAKGFTALIEKYSK